MGPAKMTLPQNSDQPEHVVTRSKYYEHIAGRIDMAKRKADILTKNIGHRGIEGEIREIALKECIEPFLTHSYSCGTGKVIDSYQLLSNQMDIIIYHKKVVPPILVNRELGFFPVECVRHVIEVKSTLTATELKDSIKKFHSVADLRSFPRPQKDGSVQHGSLPATVLFAFASDISGSEIERYLKYDENHKFPAAVVICVLGKGYWFYSHESGEWIGKDSAAEDGPYFEFCAFIAGLMNTLSSEETSLRPFSPGMYVDLDR